MMNYSEYYIYFSILLLILFRNVNIPIQSKMMFMIPLLIILMEIDGLSRDKEIIILYLYLIVMYIVNIIISI